MSRTHTAHVAAYRTQQVSTCSSFTVFTLLRAIPVEPAVWMRYHLHLHIRV